MESNGVPAVQARDAHDMARRLADEQPHVSLYAFGVGRGVDKQELVHIISAKDPQGAEGRQVTDRRVRVSYAWGGAVTSLAQRSGYT